MARKRNPADAAIEFFQTADLGTAATMLDVCKGTVDRRRREMAKSPTALHAAAEGARRPARRTREVGAAEVSTPEGGAPAGDVTTRGEA